MSNPNRAGIDSKSINLTSQLPPDRKVARSQIVAWQQLAAAQCPDLMDMLGLDGPEGRFHTNMRRVRISDGEAS